MQNRRGFIKAQLFLNSEPTGTVDHVEQMSLTMLLNAHSPILLQALLFVLYSECFLGHALLADQSSVTAAHPPAPLIIQTRSRRKVPESVDTSYPVEYMTRLRDSLTDSNGRPRTEETDPTNIWCLLDKGEHAYEQQYFACSRTSWHVNGCYCAVSMGHAFMRVFQGSCLAALNFYEHLFAVR